MCTSLALTDGDFYFGRNMDLDGGFHEAVVVTPRRYPFHFHTGERVREHYAMIGMAAVKEGYPLYADAVNEAGLAAAGLHFPGNASYASPLAAGRQIAPFELIPWLLATCADLREVRERLAGVSVADISFSPTVANTPLHWHIADKSGSLVLEVSGEGLSVYENPVGVLTNNPPFPAQLIALRCYARLSPRPPHATWYREEDLPAGGNGYGALGLPGDWSSPSRFVRAAFLRSCMMAPVCRQTAKKQQAEGERGVAPTVSRLFRLLGALAPVEGAVLTAEGRMWYTTYTAVMDPAHGAYYYTLADNRRLTAVSLSAATPEGEVLSVYPLRHGEDVREEGAPALTVPPQAKRS